MRNRIIGLVALCASVAACNSKAPEATDTSTEAAAQATSPAAVPAATATGAALQAAPEGLPSRVARDVLTAGGQKCEVAKADRNAQDGTIVANCASGESFRIHTVEGQGAVATKL